MSTSWLRYEIFFEGGYSSNDLSRLLLNINHPVSTSAFGTGAPNWWYHTGHAIFFKATIGHSLVFCLTVWMRPLKELFTKILPTLLKLLWYCRSPWATPPPSAECSKIKIKSYGTFPSESIHPLPSAQLGVESPSWHRVSGRYTLLNIYVKRGGR